MYLYKYSIIFLRFFIHFKVVLCNEQINVGTVLFTKRDPEKKCWNDEQIALLRARLIYQDILPKATLIDVRNDEFLNALIKYFHLAINKVKRLSDGPTQQINLMAMCDVLGGYFRSILIPLTKRAFYSGTINYETTAAVLKFYDNIKMFLHTDGKNWAPPSDTIINRFIRETGPEDPKIVDKPEGDSCDKLTYSNNTGFIYIPIPYFDAKKAPTAIAIPFKENPLRNLEHKNAISCLADFYRIARKCLQEKRASRENINTFNGEFEKFLDADVFPHLTDEKIYPAFGGVFRIKNEINRKNVEKRKKLNVDNKTKKIRMADVKTISDDVAAGGDSQDDDDKAPIIVLICLCVVTALWMCITLYYCIKNRKTKLTKESMTDASDKQSSVKNDDSSVVKIPEERRRSSLTTRGSKASQENVVNVVETKKIAFASKDNVCVQHQTGKKCVVCERSSTPKKCPKCKKIHCRCIKSIWSTLSNYTITYPRIFPKKNTATSGLLQKYVDVSGKQTAVSLCPQCKTAKCKHLSTFANKSEHSPLAQTHFLVQMASVVQKPPARSIKSAPVTAGENVWQSENTSKTIATTTGLNNEPRKTDEKIFVFGYDFQTSSSDDSSFTDDESSSDTI